MKPTIVDEAVKEGRKELHSSLWVSMGWKFPNIKHHFNNEVLSTLGRLCTYTVFIYI